MRQSARHDRETISDPVPRAWRAIPTPEIPPRFITDLFDPRRVIVSIGSVRRATPPPTVTPRHSAGSSVAAEASIQSPHPSRKDGPADDGILWPGRHPTPPRP